MKVYTVTRGSSVVGGGFGGPQGWTRLECSEGELKLLYPEDGEETYELVEKKVYDELVDILKQAKDAGSQHELYMCMMEALMLVEEDDVRA